MSTCPSTQDGMHRVGKFRPEMGGFYCEQCGRFVAKDDTGIFSKTPKPPPKAISQQLYEVYQEIVNDKAFSEEGLTATDIGLDRKVEFPAWETLPERAKDFWTTFAQKITPIARKIVDP